MASPDPEVLRSRLMSHLAAMDRTELEIAAKADASLTALLHKAVYEVAGLLGFTAAAIAGFAVGLVEDVVDGITDRVRGGFETGRRRAGRRTRY